MTCRRWWMLRGSCCPRRPTAAMLAMRRPQPRCSPALSVALHQQAPSLLRRSARTKPWWTARLRR